MKKTLTKADIVDHLSNDYPDIFSKKKAQEGVECLLELIKKTLESGEDVLVSGFGKFCIQEKTARKGRNPATGDDMMLRKRRRVNFRCSGKLREIINTNGLLK